MEKEHLREAEKRLESLEKNVKHGKLGDIPSE